MSAEQPCIVVVDDIDDIDERTSKTLAGAYNPRNQDGLPTCTIDSGTASSASGGSHRDKKEKTKVVVLDLCSDDGDEGRTSPLSDKNSDQQHGKNRPLRRKRCKVDQERNAQGAAAEPPLHGVAVAVAENEPVAASLRTSDKISTVPLLPDSVEYKEVQQFFLATGRDFVIHSIDRVVNPRREEEHRQRRAAFLASGVRFHERRLFFGGKCGDLLAAILARGFTSAGLAAQVFTPARYCTPPGV